MESMEQFWTQISWKKENWISELRLRIMRIISQKSKRRCRFFPVLKFRGNRILRKICRDFWSKETGSYPIASQQLNRKCRMMEIHILELMADRVRLKSVWTAIYIFRRLTFLIWTRGIRYSSQQICMWDLRESAFLRSRHLIQEMRMTGKLSIIWQNDRILRNGNGSTIHIPFLNMLEIPNRYCWDFISLDMMRTVVWAGIWIIWNLTPLEVRFRRKLPDWKLW